MTRGIRSRLAQVYGVEAEKCRIVQNATDVEHFKPLAKGICQNLVGLGRKQFHVGFIGSFQPWVDFGTLLDAIRLLHSKDFPVHLTLVGNGLTQQDVRQNIEKRGMASAVQLVGRVPHREVATWIGAFDVCVEPSGDDYVQEIGKSSMKLFEYMAGGRPIVATALPGIEQTIKAAQCGLTYEPGDHRALANHLTRLSENPEDRRRMGMRGRAYAVDHHSWSSVARRVEAIMDELAQ